jgi:hypothetical protein
MVGLIIIIILIIGWLAFEFWRAPLMDERNNTIIKPAKTFKDLLKYFKL